MTWKTVCLELERSPRFPNGSASRAYLLHLPLDEDGNIDEAALRAAPALATVRRHWPNERDRSGHLVRDHRGWVFAYGHRSDGTDLACPAQIGALRVGESVTITEPDGDRIIYRVVRCQTRAAA